MTTELDRTTHARALATGGSGFVLPAIIADQGDKSAERFFTFFTDTDKQEKATDTVLKQAELLCADWAA